MAQNDVGSLLVYDKDKAGPGGEVPTSIDACVGIVTERGAHSNSVGQVDYEQCIMVVWCAA
jgi:hypothetical protein